MGRHEVAGGRGQAQVFAGVFCAGCADGEPAIAAAPLQQGGDDTGQFWWVFGARERGARHGGGDRLDGDCGAKATAAAPGTFSGVGTITIAAGALVGTFATSGGADMTFAQGDSLSLVGPASPDATFAGFSATLVGYET